MKYVVIESRDGNHWRYVNAFDTTADALGAMRALQANHPDVCYRMRCAEADLVNALLKWRYA